MVCSEEVLSGDVGCVVSEISGEEDAKAAFAGDVALTTSLVGGRATDSAGVGECGGEKSTTLSLWSPSTVPASASGAAPGCEKNT